METGIPARAEIGPLPVRVPGSIQQALLDAGIIPDWRIGLNSRACEWVENRHWVLTCDLPADWCAKPGAKRLVCDGIDGDAVIVVGKAAQARVANCFVPHTVDLTAALAGPGPHQLHIAFTEQPRAIG
jgi:hypothetical protein